MNGVTQISGEGSFVGTARCTGFYRHNQEKTLTGAKDAGGEPYLLVLLWQGRYRLPTVSLSKSSNLFL